MSVYLCKGSIIEGSNTIKKNISCDAHNYFKIICMRRSPIKVTTKSNNIYYGIATVINVIEEQEYLAMNHNTQTQLILLSEVRQLEVLTNSIS
ncbi:Rho-binding antiterminator [Colwellia asteriadis]|uniref:Rho-binding antiterminator n=1 Tax=Colwellia asteriadis TaxID=517723 RepID=UPI0031D0B2DD